LLSVTPFGNLFRMNETELALKVLAALRAGGRKGGSSRSKKKLAAVRRNAALGAAATRGTKRGPRKKVKQLVFADALGLPV
jgi:hypothetical protein